MPFEEVGIPFTNKFNAKPYRLWLVHLPEIGTGGGIVSLAKNLRGKKRPAAMRDGPDVRADKLRAPADCQAGVAPSPRGKFDKVAYQREYMRKRRAAAKKARQ